MSKLNFFPEKHGKCPILKLLQ